jgi:hypothetical protein
MSTETILDPTSHPQTFDLPSGLLTIWPDGSETVTTNQLVPHVSEHRTEARRIVDEVLEDYLAPDRWPRDIAAAEVVDALTLAGIIR